MAQRKERSPLAPVERQPTAARSAHRQSFALALVFWVFLFIFTRQGIQGQNDLSRFVSVESLVHRGTLVIDESPYAQKMVERDGTKVHYLCDMVRYEGHFYSSKPPVFTYILAWVARGLMVFGAQIRFTGLEAYRSTFALTWLVVGALSAGALYAFRRALARQYAPLEASMLTGLTLCGTLFLTYSVTTNHHTVTASLILVSFLLFRMDEGKKKVEAGRAFAAGFLMGLATVIDVGHGFIFSIGFALYVLFYMRSLPTLLLYGLGSIPPLAFHCVVQYQTFHTIFPVQFCAGMKDYPGSYWHHEIGADAWQIPRWKYWFLTLFSTRGLFLLSPILIFGMAGLKSEVIGRAEGRPFAALTVLFCIAFLFVYHSFMAPTNFGGACYGFRWYIGFTPLLALYAARQYETVRNRPLLRQIFYALGAISVAYALIGMQEPWRLMENNTHPAVRFLMLFRGF